MRVTSFCKPRACQRAMSAFDAVDGSSTGT
jgi:hypothetical protein